jgi:Putative Actinobacterial Holin-X, holin superfamily III
LAFFRSSEPPAGQSVTHLIEDLAQDTGRLVQLEIALLKQETIELVKRNAIAVAMLAGAGLCALLTLIFALVLLIQLSPNHVLVAVIVCVVWLAAAIVLGLAGKARLRVAVPTQALESVKEDMAWAKQQLKFATK